jgi:hypothetical protein
MPCVAKKRATSINNHTIEISISNCGQGLTQIFFNRKCKVGILIYISQSLALLSNDYLGKKLIRNISTTVRDFSTMNETDPTVFNVCGLFDIIYISYTSTTKSTKLIL